MHAMLCYDDTICLRHKICMMDIILSIRSIGGIGPCELRQGKDHLSPACKHITGLGWGLSSQLKVT